MHKKATAEKSTLYVVATPIGNLGDISLRALEILSAVDVVAAEDTRTSSNLLRGHGIEARLLALHAHNERDAARRIVDVLRSGRSAAFVADAGTPAVSDPGAVLVQCARAAGFKVVAVPGPNAAMAALSVAGLEDPRFLFYGFLPPKQGARRRALETLRALPWTLVFYEAPHRVPETIADMKAVFGGGRRITIARELTKLFETVHTCALAEAQDWIAADANRQKGEFVLLLEGAAPQSGRNADDNAARVLQTLLEDLTVKRAADVAARITGASKKALYQLALTLKKKRPPGEH